MQSIKVSGKTEWYLSSMWFPPTLFLFYLHPCRALIDFYFLSGHHLTAVLALTLLVLGISSLLAPLVVLCYRPKLGTLLFLSCCCCRLFYFAVISLILSHLVPALFLSSLTVMKASTSNRSMLMSPY